MVGYVEGVRIGEHELIKRFMKGVFKLRPSVPRYSSTWDPAIVLNFLEALPENNELSLKQISFKTLGLLALATGQRVQSLASIKIDNILWGEVVKIVLDAVLKTTKAGQPNPVLMLPKYVANSKLCVSSALRCYIERTQVQRDSLNTSNLFLGLTKPHKPVCSQTLSHWLVKLLTDSGVDTSQYKGHSFRHSSSSMVASKGVSVDTIMNSVGWRSSQTFARFYNRNIENDCNIDYANAILNS